jgi:hypothetical protein
MLRFFRQIRQKLIVQENIRKYVWYALGEILLVVIGILIALQVNNWNENRVDREYEIQMLGEINSALEKDINYLDGLTLRLTKMDSSIVEMKKKASMKVDFIDSLYIRKSNEGRWYQLMTGIVFQANRGPYEALKAEGLNVVRSEDLRNKLIYLYDFSEPRTRSLIEFFTADYVRQRERLKSFLEEPLIVVIEGEQRIVSKFPSDLFKNPDFLTTLNDMSDRSETERAIINSLISDMKSLKESLNKELN